MDEISSSRSSTLSNSSPTSTLSASSNQSTNSSNSNQTANNGPNTTQQAFTFVTGVTNGVQYINSSSSNSLSYIVNTITNEIVELKFPDEMSRNQWATLVHTHITPLIGGG